MTNQISLPKDAEGREIPLDTTVLFDEYGNKLCVKRIDFGSFSREWMFRLIEIDGGILRTRALYPEQVYLENPVTPDSWEKLLEDLSRCESSPFTDSCAYYDKEDVDCSLCPAVEASSCSTSAFKNIAARIRKLRGDDDD